MKMSINTHLISQGLATALQIANATLPSRHQALACGILSGLQMIVAAIAHYSNPDGTDARAAWAPEKSSK